MPSWVCLALAFSSCSKTELQSSADRCDKSGSAARCVFLHLGCPTAITHQKRDNVVRVQLQGIRPTNRVLDGAARLGPA